MAIKMRFHEWPGTGLGTHTYTDTRGTIQFTHYVNFGAQTYNWANMPVTDLTAANADIADLMYHAGVAVDMDYEVGGSGAWPTTYSMNGHFWYKGTEELTSGHNDHIINSVLGGLPVVTSTFSHTVLIDGYRDTMSPFFHINVGWGGTANGWYNLDQIPGGNLPVERSYPYSSPYHYYYLDQSANVWPFLGTIQYPFRYLVEGLEETPSNGHLWLMADSYGGTGSFTKPMTIHSYHGTAIIGE